MKFLLIIVLSLVTLSLGCSKELPNSSLPSPTSKPESILEISSNATGMYSVVGKFLFIRLYDNYEIEFEYFDSAKMKKGINQAEDVKVLKKTIITKEEFQQFTNLLNSEDFQRTSGEFKRKCCCTDASTNYEIVYKVENDEKRINLYSFCDLGDLTKAQTEKGEKVPKSVSDLMILANLIVSKNSPR